MPCIRGAALTLALTVPALAGCVQATRHSNTMVFGTNTSLAVRVGQSVTQVPEISVGYTRQEAVIMPLLANTGDSGGANGVLSPCGVPFPRDQAAPPAGERGTATTTLPETQAAPHPCKFVATKSVEGRTFSQDSYSVLASFGANIKARSPGDSTTGEIGVGLAQYFATGVAAQLLAANGGAAVVSVSAAAKESAKSTGTGQATAAVVGFQVEPTPVGSGTSFDAAWGKLLQDVAATQDQDKSARISIVTAAVMKANIKGGARDRIMSECSKSKEDCLAKLSGSSDSFNTPEFTED